MSRTTETLILLLPLFLAAASSAQHGATQTATASLRPATKTPSLLSPKLGPDGAKETLEEIASSLDRISESMNESFFSKILDSQILAVVFGALLSLCAAWGMAQWNHNKAVMEKRKENTFKLNETYMDQVLDRLKTKVNLVEVSKAKRINGFWGTVEELEDDGKESLRKVLSFFDSLQDLKEHDLIDLESARGLFSREYKNLYPQIREMADTESPRNPGQGPTLTQRVCKAREWLLEGDRIS